MATPIHSFDTQHEDMIHDAQFDYYGKHLATASSDRTVRIFEVGDKSSKLVSELKGHEGPVWQVAWAHPQFGNVIASCSYDHKVIIWRENNNSSGQWGRIYEYKHDASVNAVSWAPQEAGLALATASSDGIVSVIAFSESEGKWEEPVQIHAHDVGCNCVSWGPMWPVGSLLSNEKPAAPLRQLVSGGGDGKVKIWVVGEDNTWKSADVLEGHKDWVRDVAWAPNIGLPFDTIASCSQDQTVCIWTRSQGKFELSEKLPLQSVVWRVSWSTSGSILAVSTANNEVLLFKEVEGKWQQMASLEDKQKGAALQQQAQQVPPQRM